jgi:glycosyltransferase involved in cell wall biosynthesis
MKLGAAKQLYAESVAVVIPLRANPIGAGTATMVEAMLMGKPVVITRSPDKTFAGRRDLVDGENVVIVDPGNAAVLREAIQRVVTDQDFRRRIATGGREWARRHADRKEWLAIMIGALRGPEPGKDSASAGR